jgi:co-chaperonin GroES (HSP10)
MTPFEALYGRPYHTPLSWSESGERVIFGPDIVTEAEEKVKQIQANILATQSRQKSYTDKRRNPLEFEVGDHIYLQSPQ